MDAATAPTPESSSSPVAMSDAGPDGAVAAPPSPDPPSVTIHGQKVALAELQRHFDPKCPAKCAEGILIVGRPAPRGFKGVMRVPELCDCTIRGYVAGHPAPPAVPELGARAARALAGARPPRNDRASKQAARLREAIARQHESLIATEAPIGEETLALDAEERENAERVAILGDCEKEARRRLEALRAQVSGVQAEIAAHAEALANRETLARSITERRRQLEAKNAGVMKRAANLRAEIQKLERRLTAAVIYHPEVVGG